MNRLCGGKYYEKIYNCNIVIITGLALIGLVGTLYYQLYSLSSVLGEFDFSKNDIVTIKEYPRSSDNKESSISIEINKLFLLANKDQLGLIIAHKNKYGLWKKQGIAYVTKDLSNGQYVLQSLYIPKDDLGEEWFQFWSENYIFIASYIDSPISTDILTADDFQLSIEQFKVNKRNLLFVEAKADNKKESFGSDEILTYLQNELDDFK